MKTLPIDDHKLGIFSHKLGHFFPIFEKGQGRPPPLPPLVTRLIKSSFITKEICELLIGNSRFLI